MTKAISASLTWSQVLAWRLRRQGSAANLAVTLWERVPSRLLEAAVERMRSLLRTAGQRTEVGTADG